MADSAAASSGASALPAALVGLDAPVESLLQRPSWRKSEFDRIAQRCGLVAESALEADNEQSFERFGHALVEEEDVLTVNPDARKDSVGVQA